MKPLVNLLTAAVMVLCAFGAGAAVTPEEQFYSPKTAFTWGADAGASIDMTGNDMSTVDFDIYFGMRRRWIEFLGVGVGADIMVTNSCRSFPLYAAFRTNFVNRPTIAFMDVRIGASLNYLEHNHQQTGLSGFAGVGFNLARGRRFSSHILVGYTYRERRHISSPEMEHDFGSLSCATVKIGVVF